MKIYVASSWRNPHQPGIVAKLRAAGHEVYDFRHPPGGEHLGFSWSDVDLRWTEWRVDDYLLGLVHPIAVAGFESDFEALRWADAGVLLLPCGRSAHLEAGWIIGAGKPLWIVLDPVEFEGGSGHATVELMYRLATAVLRDPERLVDAIARYGQ